AFVWVTPVTPFDKPIRLRGREIVCSHEPNLGFMFSQGSTHLILSACPPAMESTPRRIASARHVDGIGSYLYQYKHDEEPCMEELCIKKSSLDLSPAVSVSSKSSIP